MGVVITVIVDTAEIVQVFNSPMTVYVSVALGAQITILLLVLLKLADAFQVYVVAPLMVNVPEVPEQIL